MSTGGGNEYRIPSDDVIKKAGKVIVMDAEAKPVLFKSLYGAAAGQCRRAMVIFIRHFFCGVSPRFPVRGAYSSSPGNSMTMISSC